MSRYNRDIFTRTTNVRGTILEHSMSLDSISMHKPAADRTQDNARSFEHSTKEVAVLDNQKSIKSCNTELPSRQPRKDHGTRCDDK